MPRSPDVMSREEVAEYLGTTPMKVTAAIKNGTMPIGAVLCEDGTGDRERTIILRPRWDAWRTGKDLGN